MIYEFARIVSTYGLERLIYVNQLVRMGFSVDDYGRNGRQIQGLTDYTFS
jgi:hypothetical protein